MWDVSMNELRKNQCANKIVIPKKVQNFAFGLDDKKISEEEDKILYEHYKKSVLARSFGNTFENYKNSRVSFPPNTAPGIVRKVWREQMEKGTPKQREEMANLSFMYDVFMYFNKDYKKDMPNDVWGYMKLMKDLDKYSFDNYYKAPEVESGFCEGISSAIGRFQADLSKYSY